MTLSAIIGQFPYSRLLLHHRYFLEISILHNSQPPRLNERNGQILGYYIRYGQLGSETLSKKTIRDTENLQVRLIFMFSHSDTLDNHIWADPVFKYSIVISCSDDASDNDLWTGPCSQNI